MTRPRFPCPNFDPRLAAASQQSEKCQSFGSPDAGFCRERSKNVQKAFSCFSSCFDINLTYRLPRRQPTRIQETLSLRVLMAPRPSACKCTRCAPWLWASPWLQPLPENWSPGKTFVVRHLTAAAILESFYLRLHFPVEAQAALPKHERTTVQRSLNCNKCTECKHISHITYPETTPSV